MVAGEVISGQGRTRVAFAVPALAGRVEPVATAGVHAARQLDLDSDVNDGIRIDTGIDSGIDTGRDLNFRHRGVTSPS
jgi:hypothetical protein